MSLVAGRLFNVGVKNEMKSAGFKLKLYLILLLVILGIGTIVFARVENLSLLDAFYFSLVTIATVGYGDIHPTTSVGKVLAILLIIAGVGTFLEVIASITRVMIRRSDKEIRAEKLNMIVGLFFSEMGTRLLKTLSVADVNPCLLSERLKVSGDWTERHFREEAGNLARHEFDIGAHRVDLENLRRFLDEKGGLLLRLLENPILLEHGSFTELLRTIFHLREELMNRDEVSGLPDADMRHLSGDMERVYRSLAIHWLNHISYLKVSYPYLFSLAVRTNPFDREATAIVSE
jgi:voltage-gated potassium channel